MRLIKNFAITLLLALFSYLSFANSGVYDKPIIFIGASFTNANVPIDNELVSALGGVSVGAGLYLDLASAVIRDKKSAGLVKSEAEAGATTFARAGCNPGPECGPGGWTSYQTQLDKAIPRVTTPTGINAEYVVIGIANDCLHTDAFGVPQAAAPFPCNNTQINEYADRLIAVGESVLAYGLTPIFEILPKYSNLDLELTASLFGLLDIADESAYNNVRSGIKSRLTQYKAEVATRGKGQKVLIAKIWNKDFAHFGDGLHPDRTTVERAAKKLLKIILDDQS